MPSSGRKRGKSQLSKMSQYPFSDTTQEDLHSVTFIVRGIITEHRRTAQVCCGLFKTLLLTNSHTMYINI